MRNRTAGGPHQLGLHHLVNSMRLEKAIAKEDTEGHKGSVAFHMTLLSVNQDETEQFGSELRLPFSPTFLQQSPAYRDEFRVRFQPQ